MYSLLRCDESDEKIFQHYFIASFAGSEPWHYSTTKQYIKNIQWRLSDTVTLMVLGVDFSVLVLCCDMMMSIVNKLKFPY